MSGIESSLEHMRELLSSPVGESDGAGIKSSTETQKARYRTFPAILQDINSLVHDEHNRNPVYQEISKEYNRSLRDGRYEVSVICLMIMRLILLEEKRPNDAGTMVEIAVNILHEIP